LTDTLSAPPESKRQAATSEIHAQLDKLWSLATHETNRLLHRALGKLKFIIRDGELIDLA
jgi:hypothetical protein